MFIHQLIFRNIKRNLRHYYLYFFALVCSAALYFAFVTLQYEAAAGELDDSFKVQAGIEVASYLLVFIVTVFLLYANGLFLKRRTKEIGLYQLAGMTKGQVSFLFMMENAILYAGSLLAGILTGFIGSKLLMMMILYKMIGMDQVAVLKFSWQAVGQTVIVIMILYVLLMVMTTLQIGRQTLLALFQQQNKTESPDQRVTWYQVAIGIARIPLITSGYYTSAILFDGDFGDFAALTRMMGYTLASTIIGTYFIYKGSVTLLLLIIRKSKQGYLTIQQVLSIGSIMFRIARMLSYSRSSRQSWHWQSVFYPLAPYPIILLEKMLILQLEGQISLSNPMMISSNSARSWTKQQSDLKGKKKTLFSWMPTYQQSSKETVTCHPCRI
ncbi:ABC transporter permease [Terribacillus halophilus]|uniref:ABC transporter permease n=1 Tax=Terribacillus halophilus TaxID=361279 RepID=UPI0039823723